ALSTRFMTLGAVLLMQPNATQEAKKRRFKDWLTWKTIERDLTLDMRSVIKRTDYEYEGRNNPGVGLVKTRAKEVRQLRDFALPYPDSMVVGTVPVSLLSTPYPLQWKGQTGLENEMIDGISAVEYYHQFDESSID
ncbi:MAG TPA: hypothetical protein VFK47_13240, partial [Ktedonobacteraceae bacterium]|nr:hypothetical protein [Ktedonobacteraceae bacterium]